ncbi:MAG: oligosaccharide flippase family protein [Polyangiales bacterium]
MDLGRLVRNITSQWALLASQLVISLLLTPFLVHRLGDEGYGIVALVSGLVGYSGVLYFGLGAAIVKFVAEHHAKDDQRSLDETVSTIFGVYLAFGVLCFVLALLIAGPMPELFNVPAQHANEARAMVVMMGVALLVQFPGSVYGGVVMGLQRFDVMNRYNFALLLARTVATVVAVSMRPTVLVVGIITMVSFMLEQALAYTFARRLLPQLRVSLTLFRRARLSVLFTFSAQSFLFTLSEKLINYTDEFVISQALGPASVTYYVIPLRLVDYARDGIDRATLVLLPGVSEAAARKEIHVLQTLWRTGTKVAMCFVMPVALVFFVWGHHVLALWLGPSHADHGREPLMWLAAAFIAQIAGRALARPIFEGLGELTIPARLTIVEGALNLVMSVVLVRTWGIAGVAFATFVPAAINSALVLPYFVCRRIGVSIWEHLFNVFVRTLPPLIPAYGLLRLAERANLHLHLVTLGITCFAVLLVYVAGAVFASFSSAERAFVRARVARR